MELEEKERLMLAYDLTDYINKKKSQDECSGFIDGYKAALSKLKLLGISGVGVSLTNNELKKMSGQFMCSGKTIGGGDSGWIRGAYEHGVKDVLTLKGN